MKKYRLVVVIFLMLGACSSPKLAYHFDYHDYNSGKKIADNQISPALELEAKPINEVFAQPSDPNTLVASTRSELFYPSESKSNVTLTREVVLEKLNTMSKDEKKDFRSKLKTYVKENRKSEVVAAQAKAGMSQDVKLAAIFGVVGVVLLIIGGDVLGIIGAVALLIGLYFFIRWLIHQ
jgi:hypothetical protein